jgi:hypothetical protein
MRASGSPILRENPEIFSSSSQTVLLNTSSSSEQKTARSTLEVLKSVSSIFLVVESTLASCCQKSISPNSNCLTVAETSGIPYFHPTNPSRPTSFIFSLAMLSLPVTS